METEITKKVKKKKEETEVKERKRIAIIRVRGKVHLREDISDTMKLLKTTRVNHCSIVDNREQYLGMINKANDYITWGEINAETLSKLLIKRGRLEGDKKLTDDYLKSVKVNSIEELSKDVIAFNKELKDVPGLKPVFRLRPPKKGYDGGGIKHPYSTGGALGYRGEKINELLDKMI